MTVSVTVLFFAGAADAAGCRRVTAEVPRGATLGELGEALRERFPRLGRVLPSVLWAVNERYASAERPLEDGDEVALIPPVSGGSQAGAGAGAPDPATGEGPSWRLVHGPISADAVLRRVMRPEAGGVVLFLGTVRARTGERVTESLEYEAYVSMAERELAGIVREVQAHWPGTRLAVDHRLGRLGVGEIGVAVAASAPHRAEAFAACRHAIDRLKQVVPIWKREFGAGGGAEWVHPHGPRGGGPAGEPEGRGEA